MTISIYDAITSRVSVNRFQSNRPLGNDVITELVRQATRAPSAFNMQNWRFIAVSSQEGKERLKEASYGQQKIADASVAFILCGSLAAYQPLPAVLLPSVAAKIMTQRTADTWVTQASASLEPSPVLQRDEAVRSVSLAAMTLMLAAQGMSLGSCPMTGFDADSVGRAFGLSATELPLMIVAVGYPDTDNVPQKIRRPVSEILSFV